MEMGIGRVINGKDEIAAANYPRIRLFMVPKKTAAAPQDDVNAEWKICSPDTVAQGGWQGFSAAAYFFGRKLHRELHTPVGLIQSAWGGSRIEPWTPPVGFRSVPTLESIEKAVEIGMPSTRAHKEILGKTLDAYAAWAKTAQEALAGKKPATDPPKFPDGLSLNGYGKPTSMYNGMIAPLLPFPIRGAIWYQGESNAGNIDRANAYRELFEAMITDWRKRWNDNFAFLFVQLANFKKASTHPGAVDPWALVQDEQRKTLELPNTGMAVINDIGEANNIHPKNKKDVGKRLARWALHFTYGKKDIVPSGPLFKSYKIEGNKVRVFFDWAKGLKSRDGKPLHRFEIAGADKKWHWAEAKIDGESVVVSSPDVPEPVAVRYAWASNPEGANLVNSEGLPASEFRTDDWEK